MPPRRLQTATIGFALGMTLVAALGVYGVRNAREADEAVTWVERSHIMIESLDEVSARMGEARSARRAYGLTGDIAYRTTFDDAIRAIHERLARVRALTLDDANQQLRMAELEPIVAERLQRMQKQLEARDASGKDVVPDDAQSLANNKLDDAIRRRVGEMIDAAHALLAERESSSSHRFELAEIVGGGSAALAFALLIAAFAVTRREVRQRERAEAATRTALVASESANAELEAFSYSVSHDLRSPLRAIDGFSQALLDDFGDHLDDNNKEHLARVRAATQRMGDLIDALLALSRITRAKMELATVDLSALATATATELRETYPERDVKVEVAPALTARADPRLLRVILDNLLANAFKFTSKLPSATIQIGENREGEERIFFVRDDGVGFDSRYAGKLFGAFQRLHDQRDFPGTGVGLATVQRIVRRHGGRIWATSEPGHGAAFFFTLPSADGLE